MVFLNGKPQSSQRIEEVVIVLVFEELQQIYKMKHKKLYQSVLLPAEAAPSQTDCRANYRNFKEIPLAITRHVNSGRAWGA